MTNGKVTRSQARREAVWLSLLKRVSNRRLMHPMRETRLHGEWARREWEKLRALHDGALKEG